jgi:hypothetical protein
MAETAPAASLLRACVDLVVRVLPLLHEPLDLLWCHRFFPFRRADDLVGDGLEGLFLFPSGSAPPGEVFLQVALADETGAAFAEDVLDDCAQLASLSRLARRSSFRLLLMDFQCVRSRSRYASGFSLFLRAAYSRFALR